MYTLRAKRTKFLHYKFTLKIPSGILKTEKKKRKSGNKKNVAIFILKTQ